MLAHSYCKPAELFCRQQGIVEELQKIFIVRTSAVAKLCLGGYSATHRIRFTVPMKVLEESTWDPEAAAAAECWPALLASSGVLYADIPAVLAELVEDDTLLSHWEKAVKPACTSLANVPHAHLLLSLPLQQHGSC